ncbi:MAG: hypothetical protein Q7T77_00840 [Sulfuricurvum sp.]|nr:hypothetical protein [Sulfuricurvum sp.]
MVYEVKKSLVSCEFSYGFLRELEIYIMKQAEELSSEQKEYNKNSIDSIKKSIKDLEESVNRYMAKKDEDDYYKDQIIVYSESIEKYLIEIKELEQETLYRIKIEMEDSYGKEIINSFDEISQSLFDNKVHTVQIEATNKIHNSNFNIRISFSEEARSTFVAVQTTGNSAKEKAQGILYEITRRTDNHKSYHRFFYGKINYILYGLAIVGMNGYTVFKGEARHTYYSFFLLFILMLLAFIFTRWVSPYCILPTMKNERYKTVKKWLFGLIVSCIISAVAYYLKSDNNAAYQDVNQTKENVKQ